MAITRRGVSRSNSPSQTNKRKLTAKEKGKGKAIDPEPASVRSSPNASARSPSASPARKQNAVSGSPGTGSSTDAGPSTPRKRDVDNILHRISSPVSKSAPRARNANNNRDVSAQRMSPSPLSREATTPKQTNVVVSVPKTAPAKPKRTPRATPRSPAVLPQKKMQESPTKLTAPMSLSLSPSARQSTQYTADESVVPSSQVGSVSPFKPQRNASSSRNASGYSLGQASSRSPARNASTKLAKSAANFGRTHRDSSYSQPSYNLDSEDDDDDDDVAIVKILPRSLSTKMFQTVDLDAYNYIAARLFNGSGVDLESHGFSAKSDKSFIVEYFKKELEANPMFGQAVGELESMDRPCAQRVMVSQCLLLSESIDSVSLKLEPLLRSESDSDGDQNSFSIEKLELYERIQRDVKRIIDFLISPFAMTPNQRDRKDYIYLMRSLRTVRFLSYLLGGRRDGSNAVKSHKISGAKKMLEETFTIHTDELAVLPVSRTQMYRAEHMTVRTRLQKQVIDGEVSANMPDWLKAQEVLMSLMHSVAQDANAEMLPEMHEPTSSQQQQVPSSSSRLYSATETPVYTTAPSSPVPQSSSMASSPRIRNRTAALNDIRQARSELNQMVEDPLPAIERQTAAATKKKAKVVIRDIQDDDIYDLPLGFDDDDFDVDMNNQDRESDEDDVDDDDEDDVDDDDDEREAGTSSRFKRLMTRGPDGSAIPVVEVQSGPPVPLNNASSSTGAKRKRPVARNDDEDETNDARLSKPKQRRMTNRWSEEETAALERGIVKHGFRWRVILNETKILQRKQRTNVDLKDRARVVLRQRIKQGLPVGVWSGKVHSEEPENANMRRSNLNGIREESENSDYEQEDI